MTIKRAPVVVPEPPSPPRSEFFGGMPVERMTKEPPRRNWLTEGVMLARSMFFVIGEPGSGKTFLMVDWMCAHAHCAIDDRLPCLWFGRTIKPCGIVYIAGEGQDDFEVRMHAWMERKGVEKGTPMPIWVIPRPVDMRTSSEQTLKLIDEIQAVDRFFMQVYGVHVGIVVCDTFNKMLMAGDDSRPEHVGAFMENGRLIRERTGAAVVAVAHTVKRAGTFGRTDARGHGSITGDNDGEIFVTRAIEDRPHQWTITRNKAGPEGDRHEFRLPQVTVGEAGDDKKYITSCVVVEGAVEKSLQGAEAYDAEQTLATGTRYVTSDGRVILKATAFLIFKSLVNAIRENGVYAAEGVKIPYGQGAVTQAQWIDEMVKSMPGDKTVAKRWRQRCTYSQTHAATTFSNRGLIAIDGDFVWRTSRRVSGIDPKVSANADQNSSDEADHSSEREALSAELSEVSANGGF